MSHLWIITQHDVVGGALTHSILRAGATPFPRAAALERAARPARVWGPLAPRVAAGLRRRRTRRSGGVRCHAFSALAPLEPPIESQFGNFIKSKTESCYRNLTCQSCTFKITCTCRSEYDTSCMCMVNSPFWPRQLKQPYKILKVNSSSSCYSQRIVGKVTSRKHKIFNENNQYSILIKESTYLNRFCKYSGFGRFCIRQKFTSKDFFKDPSFIKNFQYEASPDSWLYLSLPAGRAGQRRAGVVEAGAMRRAARQLRALRLVAARAGRLRRRRVLVT